MLTRSIGVVVVLALVLAVALPAMAFVIQTGENIAITGTLQDDLYAAGQTVSVAGTVDGDVAAAAQSVTLGGKVTGGVLVAGQDVRVGGTVGRTVRAAGQTVNIDSVVGIDVVVAGEEINVPQQVRIGRDLLAAGQNVHVAGDVGRFLRVVGDTVVVAGRVGKGLRVDARQLTIMPSARIEGDVRYSALLPIDVREGAFIKGKTERVPRPPQREFRVLGVSIEYFIRLWEGLALLLIGLVIVTVAPKGTREVATNALKRFPLSLGAGLLLCVLVPILATALMVTVIGIPLAVALVLLLAALVYPAMAFVATAIGRVLLAPIGRGKVRPMSIHLTVGVGTVILAVLFAVPFGWVVRLLAMVTGLGALALTAWRSFGGWKQIASGLRPSQ